MKIFFPLCLLSLLLLPGSAWAKCEGGYCKTCKDCSRCQHCKAGGTCSVCALAQSGNSANTNLSMWRTLHSADKDWLFPRQRKSVTGRALSTVIVPQRKTAFVAPSVPRHVQPTPQYATQYAQEPSWVRQQRLERSMGLEKVAAKTIPKATAALAAAFTAKCVGVVDGDTLQISRHGNIETIRLNAIDAPELKQPFGMQARDALSELVSGQVLKIYPSTRDGAGRPLAWVFRSALAVNSAQVEKGYAWVANQSVSSTSKMVGLENTARTMKVGLWTDAAPVAPWNWRKNHATE